MTERERMRRRRRRSVIAFLVRAGVAVFAAVILALMVCGALYIGERLEKDAADAGPAGGADTAEDGDVEDIGGEPEDGGAEDPGADAQDGEASAVVVIDAGHGGVQSGCVFDGVMEKDITLSVAKLAGEKLTEAGVTVIMTRDGDDDVSLDDRCEIANSAGAELFVSIHCNSFTEDDGVSGFEGYYHLGAGGKRLAEYIMEKAAGLGVKTRHVKDADYQVLRETDMPAALMEIGFLSNPGEREKLQTEEYRDTIAEAVAQGVMKMLENG